LIDDDWHHLVFVWDRPSSAFYIDGVYDAGGDYRDFDYGLNSIPEALTIGALNIQGSLDAFFSGVIDDIRIYDRALSEGEAQALFTAMPEVAVDIKPNNDQNPINPRANGVVSVAILTTTTLHGDLVDFNAWDVDPATVAFGPNGAQPINGQSQDVDQDGDLDMLLKFRIQDTGILCGDTEANLEGYTLDGRFFAGNDAIRTVGCTCVLWE
jgi:hypothetical protein